MKKTHKLLAVLFSFGLALLGTASASAATKSYGWYKDVPSDYMYNQAAKWWGESYGEGSEKNGSAVNAVAAAMSLFYNKKITPANVAKTSVEKGIWDLKGTTPSDFIDKIVTTADYNSSIPGKGVGKSISVRLATIAKTFTKYPNSLVIVKATGNNPFHYSEAGGHYVLILGYKSNGDVYVYDPAQSNLSPKWIKGKTFLSTMKSNIYFWAVTGGSSSSVEPIDSFGVTPIDISIPEPEGDPEDESEGESEGDGGDYDEGTEQWDQGWEEMTPEEREEAERLAQEQYDFYCIYNGDCDQSSDEVKAKACEFNPDYDFCNQNSGDDQGDQGDQGGQDTQPDGDSSCASNPSNCNAEPEGDAPDDPEEYAAERAERIVRTALDAAWPIMTDESAYCISSFSTRYDWETQKEYCRGSIRSEYATILDNAGFTANLQNARNSAILVASVLRDTGIASESDLPADSLSPTTLYNYLEEESGKENSNWTKVTGDPAIGDVIFVDSRFYIYIGERGKTYGNSISSIVGRWVPRIEELTLTENYRIYRLTGNTAGEDPTQPTPPEDQIPPEDQTGPEQETGDGSIGERVAARAMSFSWPFTKYSTETQSDWGKCVSKYSIATNKSTGAKALAMTLKSYPKENSKNAKLKTYPTGTKCNKTIPVAYAKFIGISTTNTSKLNAGKFGSVTFIKNIYKSLGINTHYFNIDDLRNKLGSTSEWELISKDAKKAELKPGDLLVAKNTAMVYVGDFGQGYGKVVQAYYNSWVGRATPVYYNSTYVFRLKGTVTGNNNGDCTDTTIDSVEGNEKIAVAAANLSWPYRTGEAKEIGKCLSGTSLKAYPATYTLSDSNTKITTNSKTASKISKELDKTGCLKTLRPSYKEASGKISGIKKNSLGFIYTALKNAGIKRFGTTENFSSLSAATVMNNLKADTTNWTLVTSDLTSKNKPSLLKRGDLIFRVKKSGKKTYVYPAIYVGIRGKDCFGINYGNLAYATESRAPYTMKLTFESHSTNRYVVFRAKESAYEEALPDPCELNPSDPDCSPQETPEQTCAENPNQQKCQSQGSMIRVQKANASPAEKIAIRAVEFAWPMTEWSTEDFDSPFNGYCIKNTQGAVQKYPSYSPLSKMATDTYRDATYTEKACVNSKHPPLYTAWLSKKNWSVSDLVQKNSNNAWTTLYAKRSSDAKKDKDCIGFAQDVMKSLGHSLPGLGSILSLGNKADYELIGFDGVYPGKNASNSRAVTPRIKYDKNRREVSNLYFKPGDILVRFTAHGSDKKCGNNRHCQKIGGSYYAAAHIMFFVGHYGGKYGNRVDANGGEGTKTGIIRPLYTGSRTFYGSTGGNHIAVYRYVGK